MHKNFQIIVNPISGAGQAQALADHLADRLRAQGHMVGVFRTQAGGDARQQARRLRNSDLDAILVAGGDGTISEVIDGLVSYAGPAGDGAPLPPPLAILPVGTENLLGKLLGVRASVAQAESALLAGQLRPFDVGQFRRPADLGTGWDAGAGPSGGSGHFFMVAGVGFDAEVVHRLARRRSGTISYADYVHPIVQTLFSYGFPPIRVEADGELLCEQPALVFVGNIPRYALGLPICQRAKVDDGLLDVVVFKCVHYGQLMLHSLRTIFRRHLRHRDVLYRQVRSAVIRAAQPVQLEIDGDDRGQLPVEFSMTDQQVRLLVPHPPSCEVPP